MILTCKYLQVRKAPGGAWTGLDMYCHHRAYYGKDCKGFDKCEFFVDYDEWKKKRRKRVVDCQKIVL